MELWLVGRAFYLCALCGIIFPMRSGLLASLLFLAAGCADIRYVLIRTNPPDAEIKINGVTRGKGNINERFVFDSPQDVYKIVATRVGYQERTETVTRDETRQIIVLELPVQTKRINIRVEPAPAIVKIDGEPVSFVPVSNISRDVELGVDARDVPIQRRLTAERDNFLPAQRMITRNDQDPVYVLRMEHRKKNVTVTTEPAGADVFLDNQKVGISPVSLTDVTFPVDLETNEIVPHKLRAVLPGYESGEVAMNWDGGRTAYAVPLGFKQKQVRLIFEPHDAVVAIDGTPIQHDNSGVILRPMTFAPINDKGDLQHYALSVSKQTKEAEFEPRTMPIAWDNGQLEYRVALKEILAKPMRMVRVNPRLAGQTWQIQPETTEVQTYRDIAERNGRPQAQRILALPPDAQLGSLAMAPDGSKILYTQLLTDQSSFNSQMLLIDRSGQGQPTQLSDGKSLDIMPAFTPNGDQIVFSSNRGGTRLNIWSIPVTGGGVQRMTNGDSNDLWPDVDRDPKPRLFYQALVDTRIEPRLYMMQIGSAYPMDLTQPGGSQPRIGPRNDNIIFCATNGRANLRDILRAGDKGGAATNLTNTIDSDECDPAWNRNGTRIVFASNRAADAEGKRNFDIWMVDLAHLDQPVQLTTNGSHDDCPVFDVLSDAVYFRSNRGGQWGIWKINLK